MTDVTLANLAAFGKHPGWTDFFEEGLKSNELLALNSQLYDGCLLKNINSGAWGNPVDELEAIVSKCRHAFLYSHGRKMFFGRWWPSEDKIGRKSPMVLCSEITQGESSLLQGSLWKAFETFESQLTEAGSSEQVQDLLAQARKSLSRDLAARQKTGGPANRQPFDWFNQTCRAKLNASIYDCVAKLKIAESGAQYAPQPLKLPAMNMSPMQAIIFWGGLLETQISDKVPYLIVSPLNADQNWIEVVLGDLSPLGLIGILEDREADAIKAGQHDDKTKARVQSALGGGPLSKRSFGHKLRSFFGAKSLVMSGVIALLLLGGYKGMQISADSNAESKPDPVPGGSVAFQSSTNRTNTKKSDTDKGTDSAVRLNGQATADGLNDHDK